MTNISTGSYKWNCLFFDENDNEAFASSNFSLVIGGVSVNLLSPTDGTYTNVNDTNFSCQSLSVETSSLTNVTFYLWNSTDLIYNESNSTSGFDNTIIFNYTFAYEENYEWNCLAFNNDSNSSFAENNFSLGFDVTKPSVDLVSPDDGHSTTSTTIDFQYNATDNFNMKKCELILDDVNVSLNSSEVSNGTNTVSYSVSTGSYNWGINCTDNAGNIGNSSTRSLTINSQTEETSSGGSSGGGGGTSDTVHTPSESQLSEGYTKELKKSEKIKLKIFDEQGEEHILTIEDVGEDFVNITIESDIIYIILGIGQSIKLNLTSSDYYDLFVKLEGIVDDKAELTIQIIREIIPKPEEPEPENETISELEEEDVDEEEVGRDEEENIIIYIVLILILILISFLIGRRFAKKRKLRGKKEVKRMKKK